MGSLLQDLRYGTRMLLKKPGFTLIALITLGLGIGANTAIFTIANAVMLRPLPFPQAERIMAVGRDLPGANQIGSVDDPRFLFWREQNRSFEALAAVMYTEVLVSLLADDEPEVVPALRVSVDFFRVLGVSPAIGRGFTAAEDKGNGERVAILSDALWRRRFGADREIVSKTLALNGANHTIVGVMPPGFRFPRSADVFTPLRPGPGSGNAGFNLQVLGRLKSSVTREQALAEMKLIVEQLRTKEPAMIGKRETANVLPYHDNLVSGVSSYLWILLAAVGFVLLIACANVANLQLMRSASRQKEMAVRMALGANWRRIVRQLLVEGVLLALVGGVAGLLLAIWGAELLTRFIPSGLLPRVEEIGFDWRVLAFTLASAVGAGIIFGLAPAMRAARVDVNDALKEGASKGLTGSGQNRLRSALVVVEVALALVLLIGATLLMRTFANLAGVEPGFDPRNILTFRVRTSGERYETVPQIAEFNRRALEEIESLPGVEYAAITNTLPLEGQYNLPVELEGKLDQFQTVQFRLITSDYFHVMKISLKRGRIFDEREREEQVVIVNEAFVRQYLADADPLGQRLFVGRTLGAPNSLRVVGVVGDTKQNLATPALPMVFIPYSQIQPGLWNLLKRSQVTRFVIRTIGEPLGLSVAVKRAVLGVDATLAVTDLRSMDQVFARSIEQQRFNMLILGIFAWLGLALAAVGIYGVISYAVTQRTREMGLRIALGAQASDVIRLLVKQGLMMSSFGIAIGLGAAFGLTRVMKTFLFGVTPTDPLTFVVVAVGLVLVALSACYIPARRAAKVDPMVALRCE